MRIEKDETVVLDENDPIVLQVAATIKTAFDPDVVSDPNEGLSILCNAIAFVAMQFEIPIERVLHSVARVYSFHESRKK